MLTDNAACSRGKTLVQRTISDKFFKYNTYKKALTCMVYNVLDKKAVSWATSTRRANINEVLAQELHKPVESKREESMLSFKENIWAADLAEMRSMFSKRWAVKYLLHVINVFIKYAWVKPLKDKKSVFRGFIEMVTETKLKPNKY